MQEYEEDFIDSWQEVANEVNDTAHLKGFWDGGAWQSDGEKIALIHGEISELMEGLRHGNPESEHIPTYSSAEEECADAVIRIMDLAAERGWRVAAAVIAKKEFNASRPHKHGKLG